LESPNVLVLLGAGRGGTTLLYKLLALHRDVGYLSNYQQRWPRATRLALLQRAVRDRHDMKLSSWFAPDGAAYLQNPRQLLRSIVPTPSEAESVYAHCGIPRLALDGQPVDLAACRRLGVAFASVKRYCGASVIVTKRTANNRRVPWLDAAFPRARFVHLVRDGRAVARSLLQVHWWARHTLFWSGQSPADMVAAGHDELSLAARNWVEEMARIRAGLAGIAAARILTIRYEDLLADPGSTLAEVLHFAGVDPAADSRFTAAVDRVGLKPKEGRWDRDLTESAKAGVLGLQRDELVRWGYEAGSPIEEAA
jgi:LPS sulfotransferase NodH